MRVSTAEFIQNYGSLAETARTEPVTITEDGRDRLVVLSAEEFTRLGHLDRRALWAHELSDEEIALVEQSEVPAEYAYLDAELTDWP